jgi:hypothetical protein
VLRSLCIRALDSALLFHNTDGSIVIVDYKTDTLTDAAGSLAQRAAHYAPQLQAYASAARGSNGVARPVLVFLDGVGAGGVTVPVPLLVAEGATIPASAAASSEL